MKQNYFLRIFLFTVLIISMKTYAQFPSDSMHNNFTLVLSENVKQGKVDYKQLCKDNRFASYLKRLSSTDPYSLKTDKEKLAFWINAYNAFTLKIVCDNYPVESIVDIGSGGLVVGHVLGTTVWDKDFITINKKKYSLNDIEHKIIREKFKEPRIHFSVVCASISCPPLRNEAFTAQKLDEQLFDQAKTFLNDKSKNIFDLKTRTAKISKVLDWYGDDFSSDDKELLVYLSKYLPEKLSTDIKNNSAKWNIQYLDYNWNLNELK